MEIKIFYNGLWIKIVDEEVIWDYDLSLSWDLVCSGFWIDGEGSLYEKDLRVIEWK